MRRKGNNMKQQKWLSFVVAVLMIFLCAGIVGAETGTEEYRTAAYINPIYADVLTEEDLNPLPEVMPIIEVGDPISYEEGIEQLRSSLVQWEEDIVFTVWSSEEVYNYTKNEFLAYANEMLSAAMEHNSSDSMRGGDYLAFTHGGWQVGWKTFKSTAENSQYCTYIQFKMTYYTSADEEAWVDEQVSKLVNEWKSMEMTEYQTICTIQDYLCETVEYDRDHLKDETYKTQFTAFAALKGKAVCQGYANLFYRLAREMGIDARIISGQSINHAWNIVKLGDIYYNIDATWDDTDDVEEYRNFLRGSASFTNHPCDAKFLTNEFKANYPLSETDLIYSLGENSGVYGNITWTLSGGTLTLTGEGDMLDPLWSDYHLPAWYKLRNSITKAVIGEGITSIGGMAFHEHKNLSEIDIRGDITFIGHHAFSDTAMTSFTVPNTVEDIAEGVFGPSPIGKILVEAPAEGQDTYFVSKDGVLFTGDEKCLFAYPRAKAGTSYTVPEGVVALYSTAFGCSELEEIVLPFTLEVINDWAFGNCENLKSLEIPANVEYIGGSFIFNTPSLKSITFLGDSPVPMIGWDAFSGNEGHTVIYYPTDAEGWKNAVRTSGGVPFWQPTDTKGNPNNPELPALPIGTTTIVSDAPVEGTDITWSLGADGVLTISGSGAIPDYDWDAPWYNCRSIVNTVNIGCGDGDNITRVGNTAFVEMNHLQTVNFGKSVTRIGHKAFEGTGLTTFTLPASVEGIEGGAFARMYNVTAFNVENGNESFMAVDGVLYSEDGTVLHAYPLAASAKEFTVPAEVKEIASCAFEASPALENVILNDGLETIHGGAFDWSENLKTINIPASVRFIGWGAFEFIETLEWAKFEGMLPTFEGNIFNRETSLDNFVIHYPMAYGWTNVVYADDEGNTFWKPNENPEYRMEGYEVKDYNPDGIFDSGVIEDTWIDDENRGKIQWSLANSGKLTLTGSGEIPDYNGDNRAPWYKYAGMICEISIGEDIPVIGEEAFCGLTALKSLTIPDTVMEIRMVAFSECHSLESLDLGNGVKSISHKAFADTAVSDFTVPASVEHLDDGAFAVMMNVSKYKVHEDNPHYYTDDDGVIFCRETNILAAFPPASDITEYEVPDNAMGVYGHAFERCEKLEKVILPYILPRVHFTFSECKSLTEVYFKSGLPGEIGDCIFGGEVEDSNENLVLYFPYGTVIGDVTLDENSVATWNPYAGREDDNGREYTVKGWNPPEPEGELVEGDFGEVHWSLDFDGLLTISPIGETGVIHEPEDEFPWYNCRDLITKLSVEEGVTEIGNWAFHDLYNLKTVTLNEGLETIGHKAFVNTSIESLTIPTTVHDLHDGAFARMHSLTEIKMAEESEHFKAVEGVLYTEDGKGLLAYPTNKDGESYEIPDGTEEIWGHAFEATKVQNVTIPDSVTFIAGCAFHSSNLTSIEIPLTITGIGDCAFENCNALTDVTFKGGYEWLGGNVFYREENLEGITIHYPIGMPGWPDKAVEKLYLEHNPEEGYTAEGYEVSGTLVSGEIELEEGGMLEWSISADGTLTVTGSGAIPDYGWDHEGNPAPWKRYANLITGISIGDEITRIGSKVFAQLWNVHSVDVPGNVEEIGESAFRFYDSLTEITLHDGLRLIEHGAFGDAKADGLTIPATVEEMHSGAISFMPNVGFYEVAEGSEHFYNDGHGAVYTADSRELFAYPPQHDVDSYTVAAGTERIKDSAFTYCEHLKSVTLPTTLKVLEGWIFSHCDNLETVTFRTGIPEEVGPWIFGETEDHGDGNVYNPTLPPLEFPAGSAGWEIFKAGETTTWIPYDDSENNFEYDVTFYEPKIYSGDIEGTDIHWELDSCGNLTISGTGEIPNYNWDNPAPWYKYAADIVSIDIGSGITRIGENAFVDCSALREVEIPGNVKSIGMFAFSGCYRLEEIKLHEGLEVIEHRAFNDAIAWNLSIPASVRDIHSGGITFMPNVDWYEVDDNSEYFYNDEYGAVYSSDGKRLIAYPARSGWYDEETDTHVLYTSCTVADGVEKVESRAFVSCDGLTEVTFPSTLNELGAFVFERCHSLETVIFRSGVPNIYEDNGGYLFGEPERDENGNYIPGTEFPEIRFPAGSDGWENTKPGETAKWTITFKPEGEEENQSMTYDVTFYDGSEEVASGNVTDTITWKLDILGVLTISGTGAIPDYDLDNNIRAPWYTEEISNEIRTVVFDGNITRIGKQAFRLLDNLNSVTIPGTVKEIGEAAFDSCWNLTSIKLEEGILRIADGAFGCTAPAELTIPASVEYMHEWALTEMNNVTAFTVAEGNKTYWNDEEGVIYMTNNDGDKVLFRYPGAREEAYTIADDTKAVGSNAFGCSKVSSVTIPNGVQIINGYAFGWCENLTEIEVPASVEYIWNNAFIACKNLSQATFYGDKPNEGNLDIAVVFPDVHEEFQIIYRASAEGWSESDGATFIHYGDVSADGVLDEKDANLLNQYFAGWPTVIDHDALDFNDDDMVTRADAMYLARYLAGWSGYGRKH